MKLQRPSPSLSEKLASRHFEGGHAKDEIGQRLADAMKASRETAEALVVIADRLEADKNLSPEGRADKLAQQAKAMSKDVDVKFADALARAKLELKKLDSAMLLPPVGDAVGAVADSEMRAALRSMSSADRTRLVVGSIKANDAAVALPALRGHSALTGISEQEKSTLLDAWRRARFPAEADRAERLNKAIAAVERAGTVYGAFVQQISPNRSAA